MTTDGHSRWCGLLLQFLIQPEEKAQIGDTER
jgi:hypothetical protein